jgi:hypothetical protein
MKPLIRLFLFIALILYTVTAFASEVRAVVTYAAADGVYLDQGSVLGLAVGSEGVIRRNGQTAARLQVQYISEHLSSCKILENPGNLVVGDEVVFQINASSPVPTAKSAASSHETAGPPAPLMRSLSGRSTKLTGRIGLQFFGQDDRTAMNYDYAQPAAVVRLRLESLFGSHYSLSVDTRSRRSIMPARLQSRSYREWDHRVYDVSIACDDPGAQLQFGVGRLVANHISGIGYIDGAIASYKLADHVSVGGFGGTEPDLTTADFRTRNTKAGGYVYYQGGESTSSRLGLTLAGAGQYSNGQIDREFVYQQTDYILGSKLTAYESAELNVNRGWKLDADHSRVELVNLLANIRYAPFRGFAVNLGYDNRTNFRTLETRSIPDSLFDSALRQGYRLDTEVRLPLSLHLNLRSGLRTDGPGGSLSKNGSADFGTYNLFNLQTGLGVRASGFTDRYTNGLQRSAFMSQTVFSKVNLGLEAGRNQYRFGGTIGNRREDWFRANVDFMLGRAFYCSTYAELYRGGNSDANRLFVETGVRL